MSRGKWSQGRRHVYPVGVCLLHGRPVGYEEGQRKRCASLRRCKWFRGPNEGGEPPLPAADAICPMDPESGDEDWDAAFGETEPEKTRYECDVCGFVFTEPARSREGRGEFWGASAYEDIACCPRCKSGGFIVL